MKPSMLLTSYTSNTCILNSESITSDNTLNSRCTQQKQTGHHHHLPNPIPHHCSWTWAMPSILAVYTHVQLDRVEWQGNSRANSALTHVHQQSGLWLFTQHHSSEARGSSGRLKYQKRIQLQSVCMYECTYVCVCVSISMPEQHGTTVLFHFIHWLWIAVWYFLPWNSFAMWLFWILGHFRSESIYKP